MEPRAHHVLIGLFTLVAFAAALAFVLWLGRGPADRDFRHYTVVFKEGVRGLTQGSAVQYSGIRIGEIRSLKLDPNDPRRVFARIRVEAGVPIKKDTIARLTLVSITGQSVIDLTGGSPESPPLTAPPGEDPIIIATSSSLTRLLESGEDLVTSVLDLVVSARAFLSPENAKSLAATLERLEEASTALASQSGNVQVLLREMIAASREAKAALASADDLVKTTKGLVDRDGAEAIASARRALASVEQAATNVSRLVAQNEAAVSRGAQGLNEIGPALRELRSTLASLRGITRRLEENPAGYLLGRERIEEFSP